MDAPIEDDRLRRRRCAETARRWLRDEPVFLDVETTGLGEEDEVIEVGIVDVTDEVLMHTLVRPRTPVSEGAREVHGLSEEDLEDAPTWDRVHDTFLEHVRGRTVVIYNREFDVGMVNTSAARFDRSVDGWEPVECAMRLYATWCGEWSQRHGSYRFQRLERAMEEFELAPVQSHRAVDDARLTRGLVQSIANHTEKSGFLEDLLTLFGS